MPYIISIITWTCPAIALIFCYLLNTSFESNKGFDESNILLIVSDISFCILPEVKNRI